MSTELTAPVVPDAPITFWSFSALKDFEACPFKVYLKRVRRTPGPVLPEDNPLIRGNRIHKEAELFVKGEGMLTRDLRKVADELQELAEAYQEQRLEVEQSWWCDRNWQPVDMQHPERWHVVICDAFEHVSEEQGYVTDYKTGKSFGNEIKHGEQMQLYAIQAFMRYPALRVVTVRLLYVDEGKAKTREYDRTKVAALIPRWEQRSERLTSATVFPPKANRGNCKYCDYGPNNNGTNACPYGVKL